MLTVAGGELRIVVPPESSRRPARWYGVLTAVVGGFLGLYPLLLGVVVIAVPQVAGLVGFDAGDGGARIGLGIGLLVCGGLFTAIGVLFFRAWRLMARRARAAHPTLLIGCRPDGLLTPDGGLVPWASVTAAAVSWQPAPRGRPITVGGHLGQKLGRSMTAGAGLDGMIRQVDFTLEGRPPLRAAVGPFADDREFRRFLDAVGIGLAPYGRAPR